MPGPPPQPTNLKLLRGNPGKRALPKDEPRLKPELPRPPTYLLPDEKKLFRKVAKQLMAAKVVTQIDGHALALYVQSFTMWRHATEKLASDGYIEMSPQGMPTQSPWVHIASKAFAQMKTIMAEFGMTPSSRTRVVALPNDKPTEADPWGNI